MSHEIRSEIKLAQVRRVYDVRCDQCGVELKPVKGLVDVDDDGGWSHLQAEGALEIVLVGQYAGFFDPSDGRVRLLLCRSCAEDVCKSFGSFRRAVNDAW